MALTLADYKFDVWYDFCTLLNKQRLLDMKINWSILLDKYCLREIVEALSEVLSAKKTNFFNLQYQINETNSNLKLALNGI